MGVYINTFRTEHKKVSFEGAQVNVHAFRYLCRANDADSCFGANARRARLLQSNMEKASERFDKIKPTYAAHVHDKDWNDVTVVTDIKSGVNIDTDSIGKIVGFLWKSKRGGWTISFTRFGKDFVIKDGNRYAREYTERVVDGAVVKTTDSETLVS